VPDLVKLGDLVKILGELDAVASVGLMVGLGDGSTKYAEKIISKSRCIQYFMK